LKNLAHPERKVCQIDIQFGKQKLAKALGFGKKQIHINVAAADPATS
jgi:hypothetical protein